MNQLMNRITITTQTIQTKNKAMKKFANERLINMHPHKKILTILTLTVMMMMNQLMDRITTQTKNKAMLTMMITIIMITMNKLAQITNKVTTMKNPIQMKMNLILKIMIPVTIIKN
jgi:hypothetical protein